MEKRGSESIINTVRSVSSDTNKKYRLLSLFAASVALADEECFSVSIDEIKKTNIARTDCYEIILQSYLFLGFPRMLIASEFLHKYYPSQNNSKMSYGPPFPTDEWWKNGKKLCKEIYAGSYDILTEKVKNIAPEIYDWMILEGYGKVLSRPELDSVTRELANVAFLIVDNYPSQLYSHMRGALNMGADPGLVRTIINDLGNAIGDGYKTAVDIFEKLTENQK